MNIDFLIEKFSDTRKNQMKSIFSSLFIAGNKLQTYFDNEIPELSLKQFMILAVINEADDAMSFTQIGELLGCSRQNVKKLIMKLEQKGYVEIKNDSNDMRKYAIMLTSKINSFFSDCGELLEKRLNTLFNNYSDNDIETFLIMFVKLYEGIDNLKSNIEKE